MLSNSNSFSSQSNPLDEHDYCSPRKNPQQPPATVPSHPHQNHVTPPLATTFNEADNDSDASSSSISSTDSSRNLVIAQDGQKARPLAPADTPSVSKPKLGRRPTLKSQLELFKKQPSGPQQPQQQQQEKARQKRSRQNTSVTDKSQWITGEEQVESALSEHISEGRQKRQRKEVHDPEFSHFTSSEYSSSEESDQDSEAVDEDDPNRPWCDCNQKDDGLFMIQCEVCEYWFHGRCVGQTAELNKRWQKEGKEWLCSSCDYAISSGTPRESIPPRIQKKEKKKKSKSGKRRGRPKKVEGRAREVTTRQSTRNARKSDSQLDSRSTLNKRSNARDLSYQEFDNSDRLKELIQERKKEFFIKHKLKMQLSKDKTKEMHHGRVSASGSLGSSLDSLASRTISSDMDNLPAGPKSEYKDRSKPNIVLQINTKKDINAEASGQRIVTTIVKKRKQSESSDPCGSELFTANPIQLNKKSRMQTDRVGSPSDTTNRTKTSGDRTSPSSESKAKSETKRKRKDSESNTANGSSKNIDSRDISQKIKECLDNRRKSLNDSDIPETDIEKLAADIEKQLHDCFKVGSSKYLAKYRSLIFNMRDPKNQGLVRNVLNGEIKPERLVRMSHDEMASHELAKWRERENKHSIELIKRESELAAQEVIVKKTHKGEEVIAASSLNDSDDLNVSTNDQEKSPTKGPPTTTPADEPAKSKGTNAATSKVIKEEPATSAPSLIESLAFLDSTANHGNHVYDMNCKICNKQQTPEKPETTKSPETDSATTAANKDDPKQQPKEPKRLRISIQTSLDPADLSRLREPLIKPVEQPQDEAEYSPSKVTPESNSPEIDEDNEELYDPETSSIPPHSLISSGKPSSSSECWSGTISSSQIAKFDAIAKPVSGNLDFMKTKISRTLSICGRIPPDQVGSYIKKLKTTTKNQILLVQLFPATENDKTSFNTFCDHLYARNRCGVIEAGAYQSFLKDFYILPIHENGHIPDYLKPINGPGLDRKEPNCLLGLLVKHKRPSSASSSSSNNTPTPAK